MEDIREGIAKLTEDRFRLSAESAGLTWDADFNLMLARNILEYLHSIGVVRKVDRELPKYWFDRGKDGYTNQHCIPCGLQEALEREGYVAVEPLVGKKQLIKE